MRLRLIVSSLVLFIISLGFNVFFTLTTIDKLYIDSIVTQYRIIGKDLQRGLERGFRYGKKIHHFVGIETLLENARQSISEKVSIESSAQETEKLKFHDTDVSILVTEPDGTILYRSGGKLNGPKLPEKIFTKLMELKEEKSGGSNYTKYQQALLTALPVYNSKHAIAGVVVISLNEQQIMAFVEKVFSRNMAPIALIAMCGLILLITLLFQLTPPQGGSLKISKKKISFIIFLTIASAQILTCGLSTLTFKNQFMQFNKENAATTNRLLKRDVEYLIDQNIRIHRLVKLDAYLGEVIGASPEIRDITLFDHTEQPLYRATKDGVTDFQRSSEAYNQWVEATRPISDPRFNVHTDLELNGRFRGYFSTNASKDILYEKLIDIGVNSLTVVVISLLFFVELLILIFKYIERQTGTSDISSPLINYGMMRPAAFLFLFGIDLSASFLPLHMETLYSPLFNLTKDTVMGLPISVEFLFVGISILISGAWLDRRGWHEPFLGGIVLAALGSLYSWLAPDAVNFILSRAVVGLGYGLSLMAAQGFVIRHSDWKAKAQGLAHLFAGIYAGSICGAATGGMLADWIGYTPVFLVGACILFLVVCYTLIFMREAMVKFESFDVPKPASAVARSRFTGFVFNRTILGLIFLSSLPAAIAVIGFLNYFSPIYLHHIGASQSTIGQVLMLYGICLIYFGPFISRYVDASKNKKAYIFLGCALGSMALLTFYVLDGILAAIIAVLLLGLSSSFVLASQSAYALKLKVTQRLGEGKAIGIFRSTSRVGQMLGPIVFSLIMVATNIKTGITYLGIAYLVTSFFFLLFTIKDRKAIMVKEF